jgi:RNA polymerase sigma factor (sigma-70 family)
VNLDEPLPLLTAEQKKLVRENHGAVERARITARREHREMLDQVTDAQLLTEGTLSLAFSVQSFDPARGKDFEVWAFYHAYFAMLNLARDDGRYGKIKKKIRAAVYQRLLEAQPPAIDLHEESPDVARAHVTAFTDGAAMAVLACLGLTPARGEADILERDVVTRAERALARVVEELRPEHRRLLELHFVDGHPLKHIAQALGDGYRGLLDEFHALLARMGARLRTLGLDEAPNTLDAAILPRSAGT